MHRIVQSLGASIVVKVVTFLVEGGSWTGRVAEDERLVAGMLTDPRLQLFGHVKIRAADIEDAETVLLNTPERIIAAGSSSHNFSNLLGSQAVGTFYVCRLDHSRTYSGWEHRPADPTCTDRGIPDKATYGRSQDGRHIFIVARGR